MQVMYKFMVSRLGDDRVVTFMDKEAARHNIHEYLEKKGYVVVDMKIEEPRIETYTDLDHITRIFNSTPTPAVPKVGTYYIRNGDDSELYKVNEILSDTIVKYTAGENTPFYSHMHIDDFRSQFQEYILDKNLELPKSTLKR